MNEITILICLYKKNIQDSATIQSLLKSISKLKDTNVFIWDNSPSSLDEDSLNLLAKNFTNFKYKHTPENTVLSKIYNTVIEEQKDEKSYLMLCDDDSDIPECFFDILREKINKNPSINLFLPQIFTNDTLISPAKDYLIKTILIKNLESGIITSRNSTAINSGMVISNRVFLNGFRYDERLRFYGTDNYFMCQYSRNYKDIFVLDVKFKHDLSFHSSKNIENRLRIFKEIKKANRIIYSKNSVKKYIVIINNLFVALKLCLKYRSITFLYD